MKFATAFLVLVITCSASVSAQDVIRTQIEFLDIEQALYGYGRVDMVTDALYDSQKSTHEVRLQANRMYKIYAVCDEDCNDIDLCIYDLNGNQIDCDLTYDDYPLVRVSVYRSGSFRLKVSMEDCEVGPCRYGIALYVPN